MNVTSENINNFKIEMTLIDQYFLQMINANVFRKFYEMSLIVATRVTFSFFPEPDHIHSVDIGNRLLLQINDQWFR